MIVKSNFRKSADQFQQKIDQLSFGYYIFQSPNYVEVNLKPQFLIKSGYYIVLSPSNPLFSNQNLGVWEMGPPCTQGSGVPEEGQLESKTVSFFKDLINVSGLLFTGSD